MPARSRIRTPAWSPISGDQARRSSLRRIEATWWSTVRRERNSRSAISAFVVPPVTASEVATVMSACSAQLRVA
jgi:hypothetical protein